VSAPRAFDFGRVFAGLRQQARIGVAHDGGAAACVGYAVTGSIIPGYILHPGMIIHVLMICNQNKYIVTIIQLKKYI
jgi:hypothetical protein